MCQYTGGPLADALNNKFLGHYVAVSDKEPTLSTMFVAEHDFRIAKRNFSVFRNDLNPLPDFGPAVVAAGKSPIEINTADPDVTLSAQFPEEQRLDETMAYYHVDAMARFCKQRFGHELSRAANAAPTLAISVNDIPSVGIDNAMWRMEPDYQSTIDSVFSLGDTGAKYDVSIQMGKGSTMYPVEHRFTGNFLPEDVYAPMDTTREASAIRHEFTHVMIWDVSGLGENLNHDFSGIFSAPNGLGAPFHEGLADYFAMTSLGRSGFGEWLDGGFHRDLSTDPTYTARPLVFPADADANGEEHADGRFISRSLWGIRTRVVQMNSELQGLGPSEHAADRIAWGVIQHIGRTIKQYNEILGGALDTDSEIFDNSLHYEILASFAEHGIKLQPTVAAIRPQHFVLDGRTSSSGLQARIFLGDGTDFVAEFATIEAAFGIASVAQHSDPADPAFNYARFSSAATPGTAVIGSCTAPPGFAGTVRPIPVQDITSPYLNDNNYVDVLVCPDVLEKLAAVQGSDVTAVIMHATVIGRGAVVFSHKADAGRIIRGIDDPVTLYVAAAAPAGTCACRSVPSSATQARGPVLISALILFGVVRRRRRGVR